VGAYLIWSVFCNFVQDTKKRRTVTVCHGSPSLVVMVNRDKHWLDKQMLYLSLAPRSPLTEHMVCLPNGPLISHALAHLILMNRGEHLMEGAAASDEFRSGSEPGGSVTISMRNMFDKRGRKSLNTGTLQCTLTQSSEVNDNASLPPFLLSHERGTIWYEDRS
jgi:hypothetical protein